MNMMDLSFKYADDQVSFHNHFIKLNIETLNNNFHTFKHTKMILSQWPHKSVNHCHLESLNHPAMKIGSRLFQCNKHRRSSSASHGGLRAPRSQIPRHCRHWCCHGDQPLEYYSLSYVTLQLACQHSSQWLKS